MSQVHMHDYMYFPQTYIPGVYHCGEFSKLFGSNSDSFLDSETLDSRIPEIPGMYALRSGGVPISQAVIRSSSQPTLVIRFDIFDNLNPFLPPPTIHATDHHQTCNV